MNRPIAYCLLGLISLSGCQSVPVSETAESSVTQEFLPSPSVKGPTEPPSVRGPSGPPPGSASLNGETLPQAITEVETVEYTLPTTEADYKNES